MKKNMRIVLTILCVSSVSLFASATSKQSQTVHFQDEFKSWKGSKVIGMEELPMVAPPLVLLGNDGDFEFTRQPKDGAIRVTPAAKGSGKGTIFFGYQLQENGFKPDIKAGQSVYLEVTARCSTLNKEKTEIIIQDKVEEWERKSEYIDHAKVMKKYVIEKRIRKNATVVIFGVQWQPETMDEFLEIEKIRIFSQK